MALPAQSLPADDEIRQSVGRSVRTVMTARGIKGKALAALVPGLTSSTLSERLSGKTAFKADELYRIAQVLNVSVGTFFQEPDELINTRWYADTAPDLEIHHNPEAIPLTLEGELLARQRTLEPVH